MIEEIRGHVLVLGQPQQRYPFCRLDDLDGVPLKGRVGIVMLAWGPEDDVRPFRFLWASDLAAMFVSRP